MSDFNSLGRNCETVTLENVPQQCKQLALGTSSGTNAQSYLDLSEFI